MRLFLVASLLLSVSLVHAAEEKPASGINALENAKRDFQQGKFDAALATLSDDEKRGEPNAKLFDLKGIILAEQKKYDDALAAFDKAYSTDPSSLARLHLADMFVRLKRWEEARAMYEVATKETNVLVSNERLRYGLLIAALGAKDDEVARTAFEKISFPTESPAYYYAQAAWAFAHDGRSDGQKWIERADGIYPAKTTAWFARPLFDLGWIKNKPLLTAE